MRSYFDGTAQMVFRARKLFALLGQPSLRPVTFRGIDARDLRRGGSRLILPAAKEAGSFQVILEEIALRFQVIGIETRCLLEVLARFGGKSWRRDHAGGFGAASECP